MPSTPNKEWLLLYFRPKNSYEINIKISCDDKLIKISIKISCDDKLIKETKNTKFLVLDIDNSLSWKDHIAMQLGVLNILCPKIQ